jgi:hypothetical protein
VALKGRVYPVMLVTAVEGETALCRWQLEGRQCTAGYLVAELIKVKEPNTVRKVSGLAGESNS